jgi:hypothetical protein
MTESKIREKSSSTGAGPNPHTQSQPLSSISSGSALYIQVKECSRIEGKGKAENRQRKFRE